MVSLHSAYHDATPMVMLVGQVERADFGSLALQEQGGTGPARVGIVLGLLAVCLALTAALSVLFYEGWLVYERHR